MNYNFNGTILPKNRHIFKANNFVLTIFYYVKFMNLTLNTDKL